MYNIHHLLLVFLCGAFVGLIITVKCLYAVWDKQLTKFQEKDYNSRKAYILLFHTYTRLYDRWTKTEEFKKQGQAHCLNDGADYMNCKNLFDKQLKNIKNTWNEKDEKT